MPGLFLYSAMPFMKWYINTNYLNDTHYVWCSKAFDCRKLLRPGAVLASPPSSNPAEIYERLKTAVSRLDRHDGPITNWRTGLLARTAEWVKSGVVNTTQAEEITYMLVNSEFDFWRPLLYVVNGDACSARAQLVPPEKRAGPAEEFIITDLKSTEFDVLEY